MILQGFMRLPAFRGMAMLQNSHMEFSDRFGASRDMQGGFAAWPAGWQWKRGGIYSAGRISGAGHGTFLSYLCNIE
jgi:hypothetical protein